MTAVGTAIPAVCLPDDICDEYLAGFCTLGDDCTKTHRDFDLEAGEAIPGPVVESQSRTSPPHAVLPFKADIPFTSKLPSKSNPADIDVDSEKLGDRPVSFERDQTSPEASGTPPASTKAPPREPCEDFANGFCVDDDCPLWHDDKLFNGDENEATSASTPNGSMHIAVSAPAHTPAPGKPASKEKTFDVPPAEKEIDALPSEPDEPDEMHTPVGVSDEVNALPSEPDEPDEPDEPAEPQAKVAPIEQANKTALSDQIPFSRSSDPVRGKPSPAGDPFQILPLKRTVAPTAQSPVKRSRQLLRVDAPSGAGPRSQRPDSSSTSVGDEITPAALENRDGKADGGWGRGSNSRGRGRSRYADAPLPGRKRVKEVVNKELFHCYDCRRDCNTKSNFDSHIRGKLHKQAVLKKKYADRNKEPLPPPVPAPLAANAVNLVEEWNDEPAPRATATQTENAATAGSAALATMPASSPSSVMHEAPSEASPKPILNDIAREAQSDAAHCAGASSNPGGLYSQAAPDLWVPKAARQAPRSIPEAPEQPPSKSHEVEARELSKAPSRKPEGSRDDPVAVQQTTEAPVKESRTRRLTSDAPECPPDASIRAREAPNQTPKSAQPAPIVSQPVQVSPQYPLSAPRNLGENTIANKNKEHMNLEAEDPKEAVNVVHGGTVEEGISRMHLAEPRESAGARTASRDEPSHVPLTTNDASTSHKSANGLFSSVSKSGFSDAVPVQDTAPPSAPQPSATSPAAQDVTPAVDGDDCNLPKMTLGHWRLLREQMYKHGDQLDVLTYKILQEFLVSPSIGIGSQHLAPLSDLLDKMVRIVSDRNNLAFAEYNSYPTMLTSMQNTDGALTGLPREMADAAKVYADNLMYAFFLRSADEDGMYKVRADNEIPCRGTFPNNKPPQPGRAPDESIPKDPLYQEIGRQ